MGKRIVVPSEFPVFDDGSEKLVRPDHLVGAEKLFAEEIKKRPGLLERIVSGEQFVSVVLPVPPATARLIKEKHIFEFNRDPASDLERKYALAMLTRQWALNGEHICFTQFGECSNGQNRLGATASTNETRCFNILFNVPEVSMMVTDQGRSRSPNHKSQMLGHGWLGKDGVAAIATLTGDRTARQSVSLHKAQRLYLQLEPILRPLFEVLHEKAISNGTVVAVLVRAALAGWSVKRLIRFVRILRDEVDEIPPADKAAVAFREYLGQGKGKVDWRSDFFYRLTEYVLALFFKGAGTRGETLKKTKKVPGPECDLIDLPEPWSQEFLDRPLLYKQKTKKTSKIQNSATDSSGAFNFRCNVYAAAGKKK